MRKIILALSGLMLLVGMISMQSCQSTKSSTAAKLLKFNFEKGKGYDYEMSMSIDQEVKGQPIAMDMSYYYSMDVTDENADVKTITTKIDRFKMNMGVMGMNIKVDTDEPLSTDASDSSALKNPMQMVNRVFGAIKGQEFSMKVNSEGKVLEVNGMEEMAKRLVDSMGLDEGEKEKVLEQFSQQFNAEKMKSQFERTWYIFPNKEVKVGDKWERNSNTNMGGLEGNYKSTYEVTDIEGDMVTLREKTKIDSEKSGMAFTGNLEGTTVVDSRSGLIVNSDQEMNLKSNDPGKEGLNMKFKIKIKGKAR